MMNGTLLSGLASASSSSGNGFFRTIEKLLSSIFRYSATAEATVWPSASRLLQRSSEAMQSALLTGWPSSNLRPARKVKV